MKIENDVVAPGRHRHGLWTRVSHMSLALAVIAQLMTSLTMSGPRPGRPGGLLLEIHQYTGLTTLGLAFGFWITVMARRRGTAVAALVPWFSKVRMCALLSDARRRLAAVRGGRLPRHREDAPLASAIHGLGLLLITVMTVTGAAWFAAGALGQGEATWASLIIEAHKLLGDLVWAYLIGHALMALLHHILGEASLREMWSLRGRGGAT